MSQFPSRQRICQEDDLILVRGKYLNPPPVPRPRVRDMHNLFGTFLFFGDVVKVEPTEARTVPVDRHTCRLIDTRVENDTGECKHSSSRVFYRCRGVRDLVHDFAMMSCHNVPRKVCMQCTVQANL